MDVKRAKILLVDDEPRNIRFLEGVLFKQPYDLLTALDGFDALSIMEAQSVDLVLLDIMMPDMDGIEVCQRIKSNPQTRSVPVVMVTALHSVEDRVKALEAGADDFLSKPIDTTELLARVRSLVRVRQLYADIERVTAEKLRFMAGVTHDIRSPLNALVLSLNLLDRYISSDEHAKRLRIRITSCVDHIRLLATDVMNHYQMETGQFKLNRTPCSLHRLIESVVVMAEPLAEERQICLTVEAFEDRIITVDQNVIIQIIMNLVSNAVKYTDLQGNVYLRVYDLEKGGYTLPDGHYPPVLVLPPQGIIIEIEDTGCGIEPVQYEQVFREFQRLHMRDTDGVGLGLSVSRRLIQHHRGEIWFTSKVGIGSRFAFFLPIASA